MSSPIKLFIVEGEDRDYRFVDEMIRCFFEKEKSESKIINLPAAQNIYMLYQQLREDNFETDVIEILRETVESAKISLQNITRQDIGEIYLFFDQDIHQNNLSVENGDPNDVLLEMLNSFDNETEHGKLYLSYPMVEALYDYVDDECQAFSSCFVGVEKISEYKSLSGNRNPNASGHMGIRQWKSILNIFYLRLCCLFNADRISFDNYRKIITPLSINQIEQKIYTTQNVVFILSGFPEFLFDYFKESFWISMTSRKKLSYHSCPKKSEFI